MTGLTATTLVARLGRHPASELGIDLAGPDGTERWLIAAVLLSSSRAPAPAAQAFQALEKAGSGTASGLLHLEPLALAALLDETGIGKPEAVASRLIRLARSLDEGWEGSVETLAADADGLEDLGTRLASLASGVGGQAVLRFLRPLRDIWSAAADVPAQPSAVAAARHLGWVGDEADPEGLPGTLRALALEEADAPAFIDIEAALERLGAAACLRERTASCPLAKDCPARIW